MEGGEARSGDSYIGSFISLTSKFDIRYEGVLYDINTHDATIGLSNVRSFGTEGRRKDGPQIRPSNNVYEFILFRGSDIKDLQVKYTPPAQPSAPIHHDPAIIESQYSQPPSGSTSTLSASNGTVPHVTSQAAKSGVHESALKGGVPVNPPGDFGYRGSSSAQQSANSRDLAMSSMYEEGYYGTSSGHQPNVNQPLHRPRAGLPNPPFQQPGQLYGINMPTSVPNLPDIPSSFLPSVSLSSTASNFSSLSSTASHTVPGLIPPVTLASGSAPSQMLDKAPIPPARVPHPPFQQQGQLYGINMPTSVPNLPDIPSSLLPYVSLPTIASNFSSLSSTALHTVPSLIPPVTLASGSTPSQMLDKSPMPPEASTTLTTNLPLVPPFSTAKSLEASTAIISPFVGNSQAYSGSQLPSPTLPHSVSANARPPTMDRTEPTPVPPLVTPGKLLQSAPDAPSTSGALSTVNGEAVIIQSDLSEPSSSAEMQEPLQSLPTPHGHKATTTSFPARQNHRGRGRGRGNWVPHTVARFTEDFDFTAMNEKFNKDEVWCHLGKNKGFEEDGKDDDTVNNLGDHEVETLKQETKSVYVKDDFFDSLSCNALEQGAWKGRMKFSEQKKIDTETFGDFGRSRGYRGGRGPPRGARGRGSYYGSGYGYMGRGRDRLQIVSSRAN